MKVSDYILKWVKQHTDDIFTLSGGGIIHLIDSLPQSGLNYYCFQHEQAIAMAMEGYAKLKDGVGFGLVTTGPGSTNTLTGLVGSWLDAVPTFFISGQVPTTQSAKGTSCRQIGDQEVDIISMVKGVTKYAVEVTDPKMIKYCLDKAYYQTTIDKPGPIWISVPLDIQSAEIDPDKLNCVPPEKKPIKTLSEKALIDIGSVIRNAKKPLLIVGDEIRTSHAMDNLMLFIDNTDIPVMTGTHHGIDMVDSAYKYYMGRFGIYGQKYSNQLIQEADLLLIVGNPLSVRITGYNYAEFAKNANIIRVSGDISDFANNKLHPLKTLYVHCNVNWFLDAIFHKTVRLDIEDWRDYCLNIKDREPNLLPQHIKRPDGYLSSYLFSHTLECMTREKRVPIVVSNGTSFLCTMPFIPVYDSRRIFGNSSCGSMGYGLPAAIGACFANDKKPVVCVEGDGSIHMNIQELQTIRHYNLPVKIFIINNDGYSSIRLTQKNLFKNKQVASSKFSGVTLPSYRKIATAYDIPYACCDDNMGLGPAIMLTMAINGPAICEVTVSPFEVMEPKVPTVLKDGKFIPASLDQTKYEGE